MNLEKPAGQTFYGGAYDQWGSWGSYPRTYQYPSPGLLTDCYRWRSLTRGQKIMLAFQAVPPERVAFVINELDTRCGSPYEYDLYPHAYQYPHFFPTFHATISSSYLPYSTPYPHELLSDCARWNTLSQDQKMAIAGQSVSPDRVAGVVSDIDAACRSPYERSLYQYSYAYPLIFPVFFSRWSSGGFHQQPAGDPSGGPILPAG